jgi:hypothetical protein
MEKAGTAWFCLYSATDSVEIAVILNSVVTLLDGGVNTLRDCSRSQLGE